MISLLCPTRGRPEHVKRLHESVQQSCSGLVPVELFCYVDEDDLATIGKINELHGIRIQVGPRLCLSDYWNELAKTARYDLLMLMADDVVFRTKDWDLMVSEAFDLAPDHILMVHGDDKGPAGKSFATLPIVHRKWVETVGYFTPPGFPGDFADTWLDEVAHSLGRHKFVPFVVEHLHHVWGKSPYDKTYRDKDVRQKEHDSRKVYEQRRRERIRDAEKLLQVIKGRV